MKRFSRFGQVSVFPRPRLVTHQVAHAAWAGPELRIAVLSDIHACEPWMTVERLDRIVGLTNGLEADLILLPGDFIADRKMPCKPVPMDRIAKSVARLAAPLGVFAVLGNHDWYDCALARASRFTETSVALGLAEAGIPLLKNRSARVVQGGQDFWLVGLDSQRPMWGHSRRAHHRPEEAFAEVPDGAPAILLAHEPDYFAEGDARAFLQISGHTHGGQINFFGWRPVVPSRYGSRFAWGHYREGGRHLVVSAGVGCSGVPLRFLQPPEITLVTVTGGR